jgi:FkbH-like protein
VQAEVKRISEYISSVLSAIRRQTRAMILWHTIEQPVYPAMGALDGHSNEGQSAVIQNLNSIARELLRQQTSAYSVDLNLCQSRLGASHYWDRRYWYIGKAPYSRSALAEIASEDFKFIRALKGRNKKCLVLDCDNTLWGGVVGEDGMAGIKLGKTYPGSPYDDFQREIVNLYHRGILIALCSKNNENDVWEVLDRHPDMILKRHHVAAAQINWNDKALNLTRLAAELNIDLDSIVFADDNEFEINLVAQTLPQVETLWLPPTRATEYTTLLASCGLFDTLTLSAEDRTRGAMYHADVARTRLRAESIDLQSYYRSLEMHVVVRPPDALGIPRVSQLTQKTNQFNLTTRRYSEAEIEKFMSEPSTRVLCITLKDKLGDSGIVGACILHVYNATAIIDTFLLSCRVLGRGVEDVLLHEAIGLAKARGCEEIVGEYVPSNKNMQVQDFYLRHGFAAVEPDGRAGIQRFSLRATTVTNGLPEFFKSIVSGEKEMRQ